MHGKLTLDLTGITYSLWEVSVAVGLEDYFLYRWILGLRKPCAKIQERLCCKNYLKSQLEDPIMVFCRLSEPVVHIRGVSIWPSLPSIILTEALHPISGFPLGLAILNLVKELFVGRLFLLNFVCDFFLDNTKLLNDGWITRGKPQRLFKICYCPIVVLEVNVGQCSTIKSFRSVCSRYAFDFNCSGSAIKSILESLHFVLQQGRIGM